MDDGLVLAKIKIFIERRPVFLRSVAIFLALASIYYLWKSLSGYGVSLSGIIAQDAGFYVFSAAAAFIYAASLALLGFAWIAFLTPDASKPIRTELSKIYGASSIAKYLPSGVLHFGSRQISGAKLGISQKALARASALEALFSAIAALILAAVLYLTGAFALFFIVAAAAATVIYFWRKDINTVQSKIAGIAAIILFMCFMAGVAVACAYMLGAGIDANIVAAGYLAAWAAGFVIPGLSAGIGVREAVFAFLLAGGTLAADIAAIALFMRLLTTAGDGIFFLFYAPSFFNLEKTGVNKLSS